MQIFSSAWLTRAFLIGKHKHFIVFASLLLCLTSCYRMPTDDDFSVIPTTNNPDVTGEKPGNWTPNVSY